MEQNIHKKQRIAEVLPVMILPVVFLLSFLAGKYNISFSNIFDGSTLDYNVFWRLRAARSVMALVSGLALGIAGNTFQTVFRNPLASPDVIGVASGASAGAAFALVFCGFGLYMVPVSALCGGLLAVLTALMLGRLTRRGDTVTLLLAGIVINALFQAILMVIKLCADSEQTLAGIEFWLMGSFADTTLSTLLPVLVPVFAGLAVLFVLHRPLRILLLPDDEAAMLGVNVKRTRWLALVAATLVTSAVISENGIISFVGLIAPHIARKLGNSDETGGMVLSGVIGADLMLLADIAVRVAGTTELPISVATSVIGAPVLFLLVCRREKAVWCGEKERGMETETEQIPEPSKMAVSEGQEMLKNDHFPVSACSLSAGYGKEDIIHDISLDIPPGRLCAIIGQNGSGKTTLIKALMGLVRRNGIVTIASDIGYLAALSDVALPISVYEMVMLGWYNELGMLKKAGERERRAAEDIIGRFGLTEYSQRDYRTLSTGQKQLVCLARTLVRNPEILILDEPDSALDFDKKSFLMNYLKCFVKTGKPVIICSHDVNLMLKYADRLLMMKNGRLVGDCSVSGKPSELEQSLAQVYGRIELVSHGGSLIMTEKT